MISSFFFIILVLFIFILFNKNKSKAYKFNHSLSESIYHQLLKHIGKSNTIEHNSNNEIVSMTWMSPLNNFQGFGKFCGLDYIKLYGYPVKKYHPIPANVVVIVGKYIPVPEHLFGPIKYASETINIEQLFIPKQYYEHYYNTGKKQLALVTGSCASVTISAITVQFVMDMISTYEKYDGCPLKLYPIFRMEYDTRIHNYLCGKGITNEISWYNPSCFGESDTANVGKEKCNQFSLKETFSHYPECKKKMDDNSNFCKENKDHKCC